VWLEEQINSLFEILQEDTIHKEKRTLSEGIKN
jgi:hypothetical protein